jgi:single-strand DNA-binding protein
MLNIAALMGRLTKDPELRQTQSGIAVTSFTLACDRSYVKAGAERQTDSSTLSHGETLLNLSANTFTKGQLVAVQGVHADEDVHGQGREQAQGV